VAWKNWVLDNPEYHFVCFLFYLDDHCCCLYTVGLWKIWLINILQKLKMKLLQYSHLLSLSILNISPDDNTECQLLYQLFYDEIQEKKLKLNGNKKTSMREYTWDCHSHLHIVYMYKLFQLTWGLDRCMTIIILGFSCIRKPSDSEA